MDTNGHESDGVEGRLRSVQTELRSGGLLVLISISNQLLLPFVFIRVHSWLNLNESCGLASNGRTVENISIA
jgi:hypothetical protein